MHSANAQASRTSVTAKESGYSALPRASPRGMGRAFSNNIDSAYAKLEHRVNATLGPAHLRYEAIFSILTNARRV